MYLVLVGKGYGNVPDHSGWYRDPGKNSAGTATNLTQFGKLADRRRLRVSKITKF